EAPPGGRYRSHALRSGGDDTVGELTPDRIDRETLDRIIRRAAELQTSERDIGEGLSREEVLALGKEVGIPAKYLQQAMLEAQATIRRGTAAFDTSKPKFMLSAAELVAAGCSPLEAGFCHVALSATLRQTRGQHLGGAAAAATLGTLAAGALTVMNAVWFVAA